MKYSRCHILSAELRGRERGLENERGWDFFVGDKGEPGVERSWALGFFVSAAEYEGCERSRREIKAWRDKGDTGHS